MKKIFVLSCIFIPSILFFAILFMIQVSVHDMNMGSDEIMFWRNFKEIWYKSAPLYALILFIVFYIMIFISILRERRND